jgi:serine/threonine protein kinase/WD40 repeat protein
LSAPDADPGPAAVDREAVPGATQPLPEGGDEAVAAGLGVEEALRLLARAWPQPQRGTGPSTAPSTFGDRIGRFTIDSLLGHGGFGIVYLAHDDQLLRWVALKIPRPHVLADPRMADRLRREARAAAGLDHPHIVPVLETGLSGPLWYLAMPYCDGPTLADWLHDQKQPVEPRLAARLVARLAGALDYSHGKGVVHGDLKPANVLLFPATEADRAQGLPWTPRLTDFGLARLEVGEEGSAAGAARTGSLTMGTPVYMSPEQIGGVAGGPTTAGDIYALGVVLYELLIGRPPFQGTSFVDVADQARFVDPAPPRQLRRDVPADLQSICLKCLEKDPAARYSTAGDLQADLERFLDNRPTEARPPSAWGRMTRWIRRHPDRSALAAVASFALLFGLGWLVSESRRAVERERAEREQQRTKLERNTSRLLEIRQRRESRGVGWQQLNFQDLIVAGEATTDPQIRRQLRTEGVAVLSSNELRNRATIQQNFDGYGVAYSPDGRALVVGHNTLIDGEGLALVYEPDTLALRRELRFPRSPQVDRMPGRRNGEDGVRSLLFSTAGNRLWLGTRGGCIYTWDLDDPADGGRSWQAHETGVLSLVQPDGLNWLISLSNDPGPAVRVWDVTTGDLRREFPLRESGSALVVIGADLLLQAEGKLERWRFDPETAERQVLWSQPESSRLISLHSDRQTLFGEHERHLILIDVATGRLLRRWTDPRIGRIQTGDFHELQVSPDGRWLLTSSTEGLRLWDLLSWKLAGYINNPANCRVSAAFHPTRPEITLTRDGRVEVWELVPSAISRVPMMQSAPVQTFDFSAHGEVLVELVGEQNGPLTAVTHSVLTPETAGHRQSLAWHGYPVVAIDPAGRNVLCSLRDEEPSVGLIFPGAQAEPLPLLTGAMRAEFDPDGRVLWYVGSTGVNRDARPGTARDDVGYLAAYDVLERRETFRWLNAESQRRDSVSGLLDLALGRTAVVVSGVDRHLRLFETGSGRLRWDVLAAEGIGDCVALAEERGRVYCGTRQGDLLAFDLQDGQMRWRVSAHTQGVVALDAADSLAVSGDRGGQLVVWNLAAEPPQPLCNLGPFEAGVVRCRLTDDASRLALLIERESGVRLYDLTHLRLQFGQMRLEW